MQSGGDGGDGCCDDGLVEGCYEEDELEEVSLANWCPARAKDGARYIERDQDGVEPQFRAHFLVLE